MANPKIMQPRGKNRTRPEVVSTILLSLGAGISKTRIMYSSYTSYDQLKEYLSLMQDVGFISYEKGTRLYKMTEKGLQFVNALDQVREQLLTFDERESDLKQRIRYERELLNI